MATFILVNTIRLATGVKYAGEIIDDTQENTALITSAGGTLFPTGTPSVDTAAEAARSLRIRGALAEGDTSGSDMITSAIDAIQQALATGAVPLATVQKAEVTLVAGTATESTLNYTASSIVVPIRNTAAGTPGDLSTGTITPGAPGSAVINSASGTDTSTVTVLVIG